MGEPTLGASIKLRDLFSEGLKEFRQKSEKTQDIVQKGFERLETRIRSVEESLQDAKTKGGGFFSSMLAGASKVANIFTAVSTGIMAIGKVFKTVWNIASTVLTGLFRLFTQLGRAAARFTRAVIRDFREIAQGLDKIAKTSQRIGTGVQALRELHFAAKLSGVDVRTLNMALQRMTRRIGEIARMNRGELIPALESLNISVEEFIGKRPEEQFEIVADVLAGTADSAERLALGFKFFDAEGTAALQMIGGGAEGLRAMRSEFRELAGTLDDLDFKNIQDMNDAFTRLGAVWRGIKEQILVDFAPIITGIVGKLKDLFGWVRDVAKKLRSALGPAMKDLGEKIQNAITDVTEWARSIEDDLMVTLLALPKILSIAGRAISENFGKIFGKIFENVFRLFYAAGATAIDMFVTGMHAGLKVGGNRIARLWGNIVQDALAAVGLISESKAERRAHIDNILPAVGLDTELFREGAERALERATSVLNEALKDFRGSMELRVSQEPLIIPVPFLMSPLAIPLPPATFDELAQKAREEIRKALEDATHNLGTMTITAKREDGDEDKKRGTGTSYWDGIKEGIKEAAKALSAFNRGVQALGSMVGIVGGTLEEHLFSMAENGFKRMKDAMNAFFADLFRQLGRLAINQALQSLFGAFFNAVTPGAGGKDKKGGGTPVPTLPEFPERYADRAEGGVDKGKMGRPVRKKSMAEGGVVGPRDPHIVEFGEGDEEEAFVPLRRHKIPVEVRFSGRRRQQTTTLVDRRTINIDFSGTINAQGDKDVEAAGKNIVQMVKATVHEVLAESGNAHRTIRRIATGAM